MFKFGILAAIACMVGVFAGELPPAECRWADTPITIDGVADDAAWKHAQVIDNFSLPWLKEQARPAATKTSARLLWDRDYLYFFATLEDKNILARITEHDGATWEDDVFELFFKPTKEHPGYYEFEINARNTVFDMFVPDRASGGFERYMKEHPFELTTAVKLNGTLNKSDDADTGWSVEGRIPWRDFLLTGGRPNVDEVWRFALCRYDYQSAKEFELSTSAPLSKASFHHHEDYAPLRFVGPDATTIGKPYGIATRPQWDGTLFTGIPDAPPPFQVARAYPKLEIKFPINVFHEPGTQNLLLLNMTGSWGGKGALLRIKDSPDVAEFETLLANDYLMYGICFDPKFVENGHIYVGSNGPQSSKTKFTRISRYTIERQPPHKIDPKSEVVILEWESDGHNGGDLVFGKDGMLYVTSGDGTSDSDANIAGQNLQKLLSKVLRIDVLNPEPGKTYAVPKDNPFVGVADIRPETWAYGLRNPWRIAADKETGAIWVGNNGQDLWEQVYLIQKGANYGWSVMEGSHPFYPDRKAGPHPIMKPAAEHPHSESRSLTGGQVYYGRKFPELRGMYIYGDFATGKIWGIRAEGEKIVEQKELANSVLKITGFGFDASGELLITDYGAGYFQLERTPPESGAPPFPRKLSETGLFSVIKEHKAIPALIPYTVNSPLWSDGAHKQRYIALPGNSTITYNTGRSWDLPEGTVLVKSFALDLETGKPKSRKWIETRLLIKRKGEWAGYTYAWNDKQDDAVLLDKEPLDREFTIKDKSAPGGKRKQTWHYPSRAECMVCHSRAANFVLGINEMQLNTAYPFEAAEDQQLRTLEHLGVLRLDYAEQERRQIYLDARKQGKTDAEANQLRGRYNNRPNQRGSRQTTMLARHPDNLQRLANPYDKNADLNLRARSYLQANCAQCHIESGGGNAAMELEITRAPGDMRLIDVVPLHNKFDLPDARLVAPGAPERSVLLHRMALRGPGQMPPLATSVVDQAAVELMREWIATIKKP